MSVHGRAASSGGTFTTVTPDPNFPRLLIAGWRRRWQHALERGAAQPGGHRGGTRHKAATRRDGCAASAQPPLPPPASPSPGPSPMALPSDRERDSSPVSRLPQRVKEATARKRREAQGDRCGERVHHGKGVWRDGTDKAEGTAQGEQQEE
ncbi:unnamed protein product [Lampetra planeri]